MPQQEKHVSVAVTLSGDEAFEIDYQSPLLENHVLDFADVPEATRPGQMRRLLCAAAVGCFAEATYFALTNRGARVRSLRGTGTATTSESAPTRVAAIDIRVEVDLPDEDVAILDHVRMLMASGCLITRSLTPAINVTHTIVRTP